ncbi:MAG: hypothetical protein OXH30_00755, partial [Chloroflexi bacterium]|nr:hypothetical protein [Chloroflexota bacterium]
MLGQSASMTIWEPRIEVSVSGVSMDFRTVEAVVDTGFTGALALPSQIIEDLGLVLHDERPVRMASGIRTVRIYGAIVSWFGQHRAVPVHQVEGNPLRAYPKNCWKLAVVLWEGK